MITDGKKCQMLTRNHHLLQIAVKPQLEKRVSFVVIRTCLHFIQFRYRSGKHRYPPEPKFILLYYRID